MNNTLAEQQLGTKETLMITINKSVIDDACTLIGFFEGFRSHAYKCPAGIWTIGFGFTEGVKQGDTTTLALATEKLTKLVQALAYKLKLALGDRVNDNQLVAIISLVFNIGLGRFTTSTMYRELIVSHRPIDWAMVEDQFDRWVFAGKNRLAGLETRRMSEKLVFTGKITVDMLVKGYINQ